MPKDTTGSRADINFAALIQSLATGRVKKKNRPAREAVDVAIKAINRRYGQTFRLEGMVPQDGGLTSFHIPGLNTIWV